MIYRLVSCTLQSGDWHYHASELGQQAVDSSTFLGWAMDGYEIYGPLSDDSVLDSCNGMTANGVYRYHVRSDAQVDGAGSYCDGTSPAIKWNYVIGCYKGAMSAATVHDSTTATLPTDCAVASIPSSSSYEVSTASLVAASLVGAKKAELAAKEAAAASRAGVPSMTVIGGLVAVVGGVAAVAALRRRRSADTPQML